MPEENTNSVEKLKEYFENNKMKSTKGSFIRSALWIILFNNANPVLSKRIENSIPLLTISDSSFIGFENATTRYVVNYLDSERMCRITPLNEILSNNFSSHYILSLNETIIYDNSPRYNRFTKKDYNFDSFHYSLKEYLCQFDDRITTIFQELLISVVEYLLDQAFTIFNIEYGVKEFDVRLKYKDVVIEISYNYKNELEYIQQLFHLIRRRDMSGDVKRVDQREIYRGKDEIQLIDDDRVNLLRLNEVKTVKGLQLRTDEAGYPISIELEWIDKDGGLISALFPIPLRFDDVK